MSCYVDLGLTVSMRGNQEETVDGLHCPKCGSSDIRRSKSTGLIAAILRAFGRWPFRCRSCRMRYYKSADAPAEEGDHE